MPSRFLSRRSIALQVLAHAFCLYNLLIPLMFESVIISMFSRVSEVGQVNTLEELAHSPHHKHLKIKVVGGQSPMMQYLRKHPTFLDLEDRLEFITYTELSKVKYNWSLSTKLRLNVS